MMERMSFIYVMEDCGIPYITQNAMAGILFSYHLKLTTQYKQLPY